MAAVSIEIGHTYAPDRLVNLGGDTGDFWSPDINRWFCDTPEAKRLRDIAEYFGDSAVRVALLDDIAQNQKRKESSENHWRFALFNAIAEEALKLGTAADYTYRESAFEQAGRGIVSRIHAMELPQGYRLSQDGNKLKLPKGMVPGTKTIQLRGFQGVGDPTYPSCEVLDTAWLQKRLEIAPKAITVLPSSLENQQERASVIAELVGIDRQAHVTVLYDQLQL